ncbi:hypothetical protein quinque_009285 [Culex quinquefasciatus]
MVKFSRALALRHGIRECYEFWRHSCLRGFGTGNNNNPYGMASGPVRSIVTPTTSSVAVWYGRKHSDERSAAATSGERCGTVGSDAARLYHRFHVGRRRGSSVRILAAIAVVR